MTPELYHTIRNICTFLYILLSWAYIAYTIWTKEHRPKATDYEDDEETLNYTIRKRPISYIQL